MSFEAVIVFVVAVLLLFSTNVACHVLQVDVHSELVFVEEVLCAEFAIGVHEGYVTELVDVSLLKMPVKRLESVQFLLLKDTGLFFNANFAELVSLYQT